MIALKKFYGDELLRLALVLSLLKADPNDYLERETQQLLAGLHISNGTDWSSEQEARTLITPRQIHPKSLDHILINYERQLFEELNSLGRYSNSFNENNDRIWNNRGSVLHTYLVNNVATDTVAPTSATATDEENIQDAVSADENVAQEVKVEEDKEEEAANAETPNPQPQPDAVVTLSADFFSNHSESDIFAEIATRSFDVDDFLVQPNEMQIKQDPGEEDVIDINVKIEKEPEDLFSDNAIDDYVPYFTSKSENLVVGEDSIYAQNLADLQDYSEFFGDVNELKNDLECLDGKQKQEDLEQYLLENTPLECEVYELAPMFEEELVLDVKRERASTSFSTATSSGVSDMDTSSEKEIDVKLEPHEGRHSGDELTQEDMDLIEVLWKQDVDMGFSLEDPILMDYPQATKVDVDQQTIKDADKKTDEEQGIEKVKQTLLEMEPGEDDPWAGVPYTIDTETGEYILQGELPGELAGEETSFELLEEALNVVELGDEAEANDEQTEQSVEGSSSGAGGEMLHPAMRHVPHHHLAHYHNQSLMRSMSMEQRWQDLATLLPIPPPPDHYQHYHQHPHNISAHGAAGYAPNYHTPIAAVPDKHPDPYAGAAAPIDGAYKVESAHQPQPHDNIYYQNSTTEMPPPPPASDGFLQSILNDEDLQLMDMAMNEGMYTMRMLDGASAHHPPHPNHTHMMMATERDSASDSAVSSMGSERVPSLSDGEWCDGSDSAQEFHSSKFRPYDNSYGRERSAPAPLQPQKKHHMFGKRCFQETSTPPLEPRPVKYECDQYNHDNLHMQHEYASRHQLAGPLPSVQPALDLNAAHSSHTLLQSGMCGAGAGAVSPRYVYATPERVRHNHTYSAPEARPAAVRDKRVRRLTDGSMSDAGSTTSGGQSLSRDEKKAKALGIPLEVHDIINLPMDEFNERLSKHDLTEAQLSLIRDIRRRGKNKVAAQNCRKRKLDQITSLADELRGVRDRKLREQRQHHALLAERARAKERFAALYRHVFQNLRDAEGRPVSSAQYSLQQAADGSVVLVPKLAQHNDHSMNRTSDDDVDRKSKNFDQ